MGVGCGVRCVEGIGGRVPDLHVNFRRALAGVRHRGDARGGGGAEQGQAGQYREEKGPLLRDRARTVHVLEPRRPVRRCDQLSRASSEDFYALILVLQCRFSNYSTLSFNAQGLWSNFGNGFLICLKIPVFIPISIKISCFVKFFVW